MKNAEQIPPDRDAGRHDCDARVRSRVLQHTVRAGRAHMFLRHVPVDHEVNYDDVITIINIIIYFTTVEHVLTGTRRWF